HHRDLHSFPTRRSSDLNGDGIPSAKEEIVSHPRFASEEVARRGKELYEQRLRPQVETDENIGKIISIDVESGDYAIDDDLLKARSEEHTSELQSRGHLV